MWDLQGGTMLLRNVLRGLLIVFCILPGASVSEDSGTLGCQYDYDLDGDVDGLDLQVFAQQFDNFDLDLFANYFGHNTCALSPLVPEDIDLGLSDDQQQGGGGLVGDTVRILNGNTVLLRSDIAFASPHTHGLPFQTTYNSQSDFAGSAGFGWTHTYDAFLIPGFAWDGQTFLKILDHTGRAHYFRQDAPGVFKGEFKERSHVEAESGGYVWYRLDGSRYGFADTGRLDWIADEKGNRLSLGYDAQSRLETVGDSAGGRLLTLHYAGGMLDHISGPITAAVSDGVWVSYEYDSYQNLVSVDYADGSGFIYTYTDPDDVHNLTARRNKADHLLNTWAYDSQDRCIDNYSVNGTGVTIDYVSGIQVDVTDAYGTLRTYEVSEISGRKRVTALQGAVAAPYDENNIVRWQYDTNLNLIEVETAGGAIHQYQNYDERGNPQTVVLASAHWNSARLFTLIIQQ